MYSMNLLKVDQKHSRLHVCSCTNQKFSGGMLPDFLERSAPSALRELVDTDVHNIFSIAAFRTLRLLCDKYIKAWLVPQHTTFATYAILVCRVQFWHDEYSSGMTNAIMACRVQFWHAEYIFGMPSTVLTLLACYSIYYGTSHALLNLRTVNTKSEKVLRHSC